VPENRQPADAVLDTLRGPAEVEKVAAPTAIDSEQSKAARLHNRMVGTSYALASVLNRETPWLSSTLQADPTRLLAFMGCAREAWLDCTSEDQWRQLLLGVRRAASVAGASLQMEMHKNGRVRLQNPDYLDSREPTEEQRQAAQRAFAGEPVPYKAWDGQIGQLAILTHNRPEGLKRTLEGYLENVRVTRRDLPIWAWDDSSGLKAEANRALVQALAATGANVTYFGPDEKQAKIDQLERELSQEWGIDTSEVRDNLALLLGSFREDRVWRGSEGRQRQWISSAFAGSRTIMADDDTLPARADFDGRSLARAAAEGARALALLGPRLRGALKLPGLLPRSSDLRAQAPVPYDLVGAAEDQDPKRLVGGALTYHRDTNATQVMSAFVTGGLSSTHALDGDLEPAKPMVADPGTQMVGSVCVTPLDGNFVGLTLPWGGNADIALSAFYSGLAGGASAKSSEFAHWHQRGLRRASQPRIARDQAVGFIVLTAVSRLLPSLAREKGNLRSLAQRTRHDANQIGGQHIVERRNSQFQSLVTQVTGIYKNLQQQIGLLEKLQAVQKGSETETITPELIAAFVPRPERITEPYSALKVLEDDALVMERGGEVTSDTLRWDLCKALAQLESQAEAPLAIPDPLKRLLEGEPGDPRSAARALRDLQSQLRETLGSRGLYHPGDEALSQRGDLPPIEFVWQLASARPESLAYRLDREGKKGLAQFCRAYFSEYVDEELLKKPEKIENLEKLVKQLVDRGLAAQLAEKAQAVLERRLAGVGAWPFSSEQQDLAATKLERARTFKRELEEELFCHLPQEQAEAELLKKMNTEAQALLSAVIRSVPYVYALQERLHLGNGHTPGPG
jgi:hypothetical protein